MNARAFSGTVPDWLAQRAASTPGRVAVLGPGTRWSFAELSRRAGAVARHLRAEDIRPGDRVALLGWNSAAYAAAVHGIARTGAMLAPLNARLAPAELARQLDDLGAAALVYDAASGALARELTRARHELAAVPLEEAVAGEPLPDPPEPVDLAAVHTIVYTSGTTGRPRGAMLTWGNHLWSAVASALHLGLREDDRWLACLPLFHVGGLSLLFKSVLYGMPLVMHESFDPERANRAIDTEGVTVVSVVAAMLQRMLDARGKRPYPRTLRCVLLGGGPAPLPLLEACARLRVPVAQTYGLTEAASQVATLPPGEAPGRLGSSGRPLMGTELRVIADDGTEAAPGKPGTILVRGPTVMVGYWNQPEATAAAIRDGWLHTGDLGYLDAAGYLYVLDRREDLIISGGENVYPAEVEAVLMAHPAVSEAAVVGVPDSRWGQAVAAAVVLKPGARADEEEVRAFCRSRLAGYKTPSSIRFVHALPRTAAGKVQRGVLRRRWIEGAL